MKTKKEIIEEYINSPYQVGDYIDILGRGIQNKTAWGNSETVLKVVDGGVLVKPEYGYGKEPQFVPFENIRKNPLYLGYNPMEKTPERPRPVSYDLDGILMVLGLHKEYGKTVYEIEGVKVANCSFDPFVFDIDGKKVYYQRPLVWTLEDKQLLIDSIYNGISIGTVIIRKRSWEEVKALIKAGHSDVSFKDVVDGKQRLNAIKEFLENGFPDSNGFYWDDFSDRAQRTFLRDAGVSYAEYEENSKDATIIQGFLMVNFAGKPQSKEHIEFVKSIRL